MATELLKNIYFLYAYVILTSILMVSRVPFISLKFSKGDSVENRNRIILLVVGFISVLVLKWLAVGIIFPAYIILSLMTQKSSS